jgi:hypothetical protein
MRRSHRNGVVVVRLSGACGPGRMQLLPKCQDPRGLRTSAIMGGRLWGGATRCQARGTSCSRPSKSKPGCRGVTLIPGLQVEVDDGRRRGRLHMSRAYFFAFPGICVARFWLSCFDLAWAALSVLAAFFCFWSRSFDLGDLSPTGASIRWFRPSATRSQSRHRRASGMLAQMTWSVPEGRAGAK